MVNANEGTTVANERARGIEIFGRQRSARSRDAATAGGHGGEDGQAQQRERPVRRRALGVLAVVAATIFAVIEVVAVAAGASDDYATATQLAIVVIVGTIATAVAGAGAVIIGAGRAWGLVAVLLSIVVNPLVLIRILQFFETVTRH